MTNSTLDNLIAKQEIQDVLAKYCRGLDRMDKAMAYSVWHDNGTALYHDIYEGSGHGFIDWVWLAHAELERHSHQITNSLITVNCDTANSETYITVALWTKPDDNGKQQEVIGRGRYLDQWSKVSGTWAIDHREFVLDMQSITELNRGTVNAVSSRDTDDPSFKIISKA